ncbi:hypothetical protein [Sphingomonas ginsenosidivorax]|uniref:hypothetical protein n=1 Tax=Sphingomonas ginsenosidivorax TaxID=862135 RepID=UPI00131511AA|nr:hypothetical protein [Sphingomonas ginsenosidivorax]
MTVRLKHFPIQVAITGASSGIGLVTAKLAAGFGAKVVLGTKFGTSLWRMA